MVDLTGNETIRRGFPNHGLTMIEVELAATTDTGDTVDVTLATYGMKLFLGIFGVTHTTANSVVVTEAPTTSVTTGTLTITVGGSTASNQIRSYLVWGK